MTRIAATELRLNSVFCSFVLNVVWIAIALPSPAQAWQSANSASAYAMASIRGTGYTDTVSDLETVQGTGNAMHPADAAASISRYFEFSGPPTDLIEASSYAFADLRTGTLKLFAFGNCASISTVPSGSLCGREGTGIASATILERISFSSPSIDSMALVRISVDGTEFATDATLDFNDFNFGLTLYPVLPSGGHGNPLAVSFYNRYPATYTGDWTDPNLISTSDSIGETRSYTWTFDGLLPLGKYLTYDMQIYSFAMGRDGGGLDFGNTAKTSFALSPDLQFSSQSGVFAAVTTLSAVPEIESWLLMISGFALIGASSRKQARAACTMRMRNTRVQR